MAITEIDRDLAKKVAVSLTGFVKARTNWNVTFGEQNGKVVFDVLVSYPTDAEIFAEISRLRESYKSSRK